MPITITCEHCGNPGVYATDKGENTDFQISGITIVAEGQRHICRNPECLFKEIEYLTGQAVWFNRYTPGVSQKVPTLEDKPIEDKSEYDIPF